MQDRDDMRIGAIAHSGKPLTAVKADPAGAEGGNGNGAESTDDHRAGPGYLQQFETIGP